MSSVSDCASQAGEGGAAYWQEFWNRRSVVCAGCPQKNVGRTRNGVPVPADQWERTVEYVAKLTCLEESSDLVELCCGNGLLLGPLAKRCASSVGVDFSEGLLAQARELFPNVFDTLHGDVLEVELPEASADVVVIYFAIQHFDQRDAVRLIDRAIELLRPGGRLLVGDVPDARKLWQYLDKPEFRKDYIQRILECRPMIGTWFDREFFDAIAAYREDVKAKVIEQADFLVNSEYRFDVLYTKGYSS